MIVVLKNETVGLVFNFNLVLRRFSCSFFRAFSWFVMHDEIVCFLHCGEKKGKDAKRKEGADDCENEETI